MMRICEIIVVTLKCSSVFEIWDVEHLSTCQIIQIDHFMSRSLTLLTEIYTTNAKSDSQNSSMIEYSVSPNIIGAVLVVDGLM